MVKGCVLITGYLPRGGLSRNSVDRLTDLPDMTSAVDRGRKASTQTNKQTNSSVKQEKETRESPLPRLNKRYIVIIIQLSSTLLNLVVVLRGILFCASGTRGVLKVRSTVVFLSNRYTNSFIYGIFLNSCLSSMSGHKFYYNIVM